MQQTDFHFWKETLNFYNSQQLLSQKKLISTSRELCLRTSFYEVVNMVLNFCCYFIIQLSNQYSDIHIPNHQKQYIYLPFLKTFNSMIYWLINKNGALSLWKNLSSNNTLYRPNSALFTYLCSITDSRISNNFLLTQQLSLNC